MKFLAACFLLLLPTGCASQAMSKPALAQAIHLEAENAALMGSAVMTKRPGFSGTGYVGDFAADGAKIVWAVPDAPAGLYDARIRYSAPMGGKGYDLVVNGTRLSGMFAATGNVWATQDAGKVELRTGANTIEIDRGWGYYEVDSLDFVPADAAAPLPKLTGKLSDPCAIPAARALMTALVGAYGDKTLSGQYSEVDNASLRATTGKTPAVFGSDLIDYSPSRVAFGGRPKDVTEQALARVQTGQIVTLSWHWNAPTDLVNKMATDLQGKPIDRMWYKGFNADATTFDVQQALADPNSPDYQLLLRDIDAIAAQLQKFSDVGVPVLWRPLHEAEGGWFWWGAKGPEPFKKLWRLMYDRLTNGHHLHNLIWVYSDTQTLNPNWYPGDDVVDVVGVDAYPPDVGDPLSADWETMLKAHGRQKLLALTEFGGVADVDKMRRYGVRWSYFVTWSGFIDKTPPNVVKRVYGSDAVVTEESLAGVLKKTQGHSVLLPGD